MKTQLEKMDFVKFFFFLPISVNRSPGSKAFILAPELESEREEHWNSEEVRYQKNF